MDKIDKDSPEYLGMLLWCINTLEEIQAEWMAVFDAIDEDLAARKNAK